MKELKYIIEDKTIAELLGKQNFNNKESAILELVKNAYDANSKNVNIKFHDDQLIIVDDGCGMDEEDILKNWMHVGKSDKEYEVIDEQREKRILSGAKGIGRFALAKLGDIVEMYTCKNGSCIRWFTDWERSFLEKSSYLSKNGTKIIISELRDKWNSRSIEKLKLFLARSYNDEKMKIFLESSETNIEIKKYFNEAKLGQNCLTKINIKFDGENIKINVISDEFLDIAQERVDIYNKQNKEPNPLNILSFEKEVNVLEEIKTDSQSDRIIKNLNDVDLKSLIHSVGPFTAELYFIMAGKISSGDIEKFLYKRSELNEKFDSGIVLYRNAFSISSFEGDRDWLELNKRVRKSPAAASHEQGSWRVKDSQLAGKVEIDKKANSNILDLSNRQGVEENDAYILFKQIICLGIKEFERYRQKIIRAINKENREEIKETPILNKFLNAPNKVLTYDTSELKTLAEEIKGVIKEKKILNKSKDDVENKYRYDLRILNSLSTIGLKAAAIAHEMDNDKDNLNKSVERIVEVLKDLGMWDILTNDENTRYSDRNVPKLLKRTQEIDDKIMAFMRTMLTQIEKKQFVFKNIDIKHVIDSIATEWEKEYSWVKINTEYACSYYFMAEDILKTIFDNLILNSIQQNSEKNEISINIKIDEYGNKLKISYKDDGVGLIDKYKKDPRRILEVHESSRKDGHGLGMWIVSNSISMTDGTIFDIKGDNGFLFEFCLGDINGNNR